MVRVTAISRSGKRSTLRVPGSIAAVARAVAAARRGIATLELTDQRQAHVRVTDIVLVQLLDGDRPLARPTPNRSH